MRTYTHGTNPPKSKQVSLPVHKLPPRDCPEIALTFTDEAAHPDPWHPISDAGQRAARRAYRASITGMDRKLGRLLDELEILDLAMSTAVIFHSDHGYHMGEFGLWRKFTVTSPGPEPLEPNLWVLRPVLLKGPIPLPMAHFFSSSLSLPGTSLPSLFPRSSQEALVL